MYDRRQTYRWNYEHPPTAVGLEHREELRSDELRSDELRSDELRSDELQSGERQTDGASPWRFCGWPLSAPLGVAAGPLLNGRWCLHYAARGFDVVTYKTVRSAARECYPLPNLTPVDCPQLTGGEPSVVAADTMLGSWAVSFGMPSQPPAVWRADVRWTRDQLPADKRLNVSVVGTAVEDSSLDALADDYAQCAAWAAESGADSVEINLSCPNVATCDGQLFQQPRQAQRVADRVRAALHAASNRELPGAIDGAAPRPAPLLAKIGHLPDASALAALLESLSDSVDGVVMTNSVPTRVAAPNGRWLFGGQPRGICGAACREASLRQVERSADIIAQHGLPLELIGVGGIENAGHVRQYLNAGARSVQLATAVMTDPDIGLRIRRDGLCG